MKILLGKFEGFYINFDKKFEKIAKILYIKNLWRRKCVRRAIFRTVEGSTYSVYNTAAGSLCDLSGVILHQK